MLTHIIIYKKKLYIMVNKLKNKLRCFYGFLNYII